MRSKFSGKINSIVFARLCCGYNMVWSFLMLVFPFLFSIDHYLGKELVENLSVLRFSNLVFEPLWSRNYIRNVQFIFSEDFGTEGRGGWGSLLCHWYLKSYILLELDLRLIVLLSQVLWQLWHHPWYYAKSSPSNISIVCYGNTYQLGCRGHQKWKGLHMYTTNHSHKSRITCILQVNMIDYKQKKYI